MKKHKLNLCFFKENLEFSPSGLQTESETQSVSQISIYFTKMNKLNFLATDGSTVQLTYGFSLRLNPWPQTELLRDTYGEPLRVPVKISWQKLDIEKNYFKSLCNFNRIPTWGICCFRYTNY